MLSDAGNSILSASPIHKLLFESTKFPILAKEQLSILFVPSIPENEDSSESKIL